MYGLNGITKQKHIDIVVYINDNIFIKHMMFQRNFTFEKT